MDSKISKSLCKPLVTMAILLVAGQGAWADSLGEPGRSSGKANPLNNVYFGEQHMHTINSFDAFASGTRMSWDDAYRWAKGEEIKLSTTGLKMKKATPYDFVAITDHSEYFGVLKELINPKSELSKSDLAKQLAKGSSAAVNTVLESLLNNNPIKQYVTADLKTSQWESYVEVANKYNDPGKFTALIAFEWTSIPDGRNMHRNVFFRGSKAPRAAFSAFDSIYPEDLWTYLEIQRNAGIDNFAIPHNSNVSDGWMFSPNKFLGEPMDARYAERQALNEPLFEMFQTKGQSEVHPLLSPNDEFASFEQFPNMINVGMASQVRYGFFRQALADGMILEDKLGTNPFKMGVVAGADNHSGYSANEEDNFHGSHGAVDDTPQKRLNPGMSPAGVPNPVVSSAGTTAVWAPENTREAIFDGMQSKETYGTSGTLIRLRFFGGWNYSKNLVDDKNFVSKAYKGGVAMGSDLPAKPKPAKAPTFAVWALKDPESGNLDRIQIVKAFINKQWGRPDEKVYDVVWSDDRKPDAATGKVPPVGNTVDVKKATYTNDIGDNELSAVWTDPDFDPEQKAVYYVRVLEIPTPRWSTYDAVRNNLPLSTLVPSSMQERAWSSPIWYSPASQ